MSTPFPGIDMAQLQAMMSQFGATEEDRKAANKQALTAFGLQLMGARKGQELGALGNAGLNALGYRNQMLSDIPKQKLGAVTAGMGLTKMQQELQALQAKQALQKQMAGVFGAGPNLSAMGPGGPTPENAAAVGATSDIQRYRQGSALLAAQGDTEGAKRLADIANSMEEQYGAPQTVRNAQGEVSFAQFSPRGSVKVAQGVTPAEKLHFGASGPMVNIGFDPFSGKQMTHGIAAGMNPTEADASKRGWANYALSKNADARAATQAEDGKWTNDLERGVQINSKGETRPITTGGQPIGPKKPQPSDVQRGAKGFLFRMQEANKTLEKIETSGYTPSYGVAYKKGMGQLPVLGPLAEGLVGAAGNAVTGGSQAMYQAAQMDWVRAKLRKESGAVIGPEEMRDEVKTYFPLPGEPDEVIKYKAELRKNAEKGMSLMAGVTEDNSGYSATRVR